MEQTVTLTFTLSEVNAMLSIFGELPTKSGVWPFMMKIKQESEQQLNAPPKPAAEEPVAEEPKAE